MPTGKAISRARTWEEPMTKIVVGRRCSIRVSTSTRLTNEKPHSPCSIAANQRK